MKYFYILICTTFLFFKAKSQNKIGYLGYKNAVGINLMHIAPLNFKIHMLKLTTNVERVILKNNSINFGVDLFKFAILPFENENYDNRIIYNNDEITLQNNVDQKVFHKGYQFRLEYVSYLSVLGAIAPYGKHVGIGLFSNFSHIYHNTLTTNYIKNYTQHMTIGIPEIDYGKKNITGLFFNFGNKRVFNSRYFLNTKTQINIPIIHNYPPFGNLNNIYDKIEQRVRKNIFKHQIFSFQLSCGILL